ncbi:MAG: hypothetical protein LAO18_11480 [Acidobacteriia bacterium]|nr:hypothetical protein [Terriglobia bacterium]
MNALPQPNSDLPNHGLPNYDRRAPRLSLSDITHAVLRFEDGHRTQAQLEVISLTGGMLSMPKPLDRESRVKLMFVTPTGPVLGTAEMLKPVSWTQQPFRFVGLEGDDQRRLQESIQSSFGQVSKDQEWIDKFRAALDHQGPPRRRLFSSSLAAFTLALLSLGSAIYFFSIFNTLNIHLR